MCNLQIFGLFLFDSIIPRLHAGRPFQSQNMNCGCVSYKDRYMHYIHSKSISTMLCIENKLAILIVPMKLALSYYYF
jgi:hypothetical protein